MSTIYQQLEEGWQKLCQRYLPVQVPDSIWRFSRERNASDVPQGFKLHISATVLTAIPTLESVGPLLLEHDVHFKAPCSIGELRQLNCGFYYGFSQVGKFITVYPRSNEEAVELAECLHAATRALAAPRVPYDRRFRDGNVYYRFGAFFRDPDLADGADDLLCKPDGTFVTDVCEVEMAVPDWVADPFAERYPTAAAQSTAWLPPAYKVYNCISQRGKGGVYQALDLSQAPARLCILKEGRRHGESHVNGQDGFDRLKLEELASRELRRQGVPIPKLLTTFEAGDNYYAVLESVKGASLREVLEQTPKLPIQQALWLCLQLAEAIQKIHHAGWVWRDCRADNVMVQPDQTLILIDFDGASHWQEEATLPWGTVGYHAPEWKQIVPGEQRVAEELFALGMTMHQTLTGKTPDDRLPMPIGKVRHGVPRSVRRLITALTQTDPAKRPHLESVVMTLRNSIAREFSTSSRV